MTDQTIEVDEFRRGARAWMEENLDRRDPDAPTGRLRGVDHKTVESVVAERKLQRKLFDAGYAGVSYPSEYGGQGLSPAHERAFSEVARGFVLPDFGVLGGTTFYVLLRG